MPLITTSRLTQLRRWAIALVALTGLTVDILRPVDPADLEVNSTDDHLDGTCDPDPDDCTLRDAVWVANLNPGADLIILPTGSFGRVPGLRTLRKSRWIG